jgi:hypothetical protein
VKFRTWHPAESGSTEPLLKAAVGPEKLVRPCESRSDIHDISGDEAGLEEGRRHALDERPLAGDQLSNWWVRRKYPNPGEPSGQLAYGSRPSSSIAAQITRIYVDFFRGK